MRGEVEEHRFGPEGEIVLLLYADAAYLKDDIDGVRILYTGIGTSFPNTITDRAGGKNRITASRSASVRSAMPTSANTLIPSSWKNVPRSMLRTPSLLFCRDRRIGYRQRAGMHQA